MQRLLTIIAAMGLVSATTLSVQATPRTRTEYVVTETNPFTRGTVSTTRYLDKAQADRQHALRSKAHWVQWRFEGINEPLRFKRFNSSFEAQRFIDSDGPSKTGKFGFAILTGETRNVASRVTIKAITVPVTGGGNGGGGQGGNGEVVEIIDRIIGIIDR